MGLSWIRGSTWVSDEPELGFVSSLCQRRGVWGAVICDTPENQTSRVMTEFARGFTIMCELGERRPGRRQAPGLRPGSRRWHLLIGLIRESRLSVRSVQFAAQRSYQCRIKAVLSYSGRPATADGLPLLFSKCNAALETVFWSTDGRAHCKRLLTTNDPVYLGKSVAVASSSEKAPS